MENSLVGVFGASGFGREAMPLVRQQLAGSNVRIVFVDDNPPAVDLNGHPVLTYQQFLQERADEKFISIAIADSGIRKILTDRCVSDGVRVLDVTANNAVLMDAVDIGEGFIISPFVTITSNIKIGKGFHANIYSYVAHDCVVGDYVTFAPSVKCNGNVVIEDHAYIGTGAIIKQGRSGKPLVIGKGAVVGMGAVVTKDVPPGVTVVGNPAKPLIR